MFLHQKLGIQKRNIPVLHSLSVSRVPVPVRGTFPGNPTTRGPCVPLDAWGNPGVLSYTPKVTYGWKQGHSLTFQSDALVAAVHPILHKRKLRLIYTRGEGGWWWQKWDFSSMWQLPKLRLPPRRPSAISAIQAENEDSGKCSVSGSQEPPVQADQHSPT